MAVVVCLLVAVRGGVIAVVRRLLLPFVVCCLVFCVVCWLLLFFCWLLIDVP